MPRRPVGGISKMEVTFTLNKYIDDKSYLNNWIKTVQEMGKKHKLEKFRLVTINTVSTVATTDLDKMVKIVVKTCANFDEWIKNGERDV